MIKDKMEEILWRYFEHMEKEKRLAYVLVRIFEYGENLDLKE